MAASLLAQQHVADLRRARQYAARSVRGDQDRRGPARSEMNLQRGGADKQGAGDLVLDGDQHSYVPDPRGWNRAGATDRNERLNERAPGGGRGRSELHIDTEDRKSTRLNS